MYVGCSAKLCQHSAAALPIGDWAKGERAEARVGEDEVWAMQCSPAGEIRGFAS